MFILVDLINVLDLVLLYIIIVIKIKYTFINIWLALECNE